MKIFRTARILCGTFFYLLASLVLLISLKIYPVDIRDAAKRNFMVIEEESEDKE